MSHAGQSFIASWTPPQACTDDAGRCRQQPVAQQAADRMRAAGTAQVLSVDTERVREGPPLPFDLGTLQEVCSEQLGLDVEETLDIAQALYETHKATTYPRSDSGYLPENMLAEVPAAVCSGRLSAEEGPRHPRFGSSLHADRHRAGGHCRPGHDGGLGAGAGHERGGSDDAGRLCRQAIRLGGAARAAVKRRDARHHVGAIAAVSSVWRAHAPAHRQERRLLSMQPLPGLQGNAADRDLGGAARRIAQEVCIFQVVMTGHADAHECLRHAGRI